MPRTGQLAIRRVAAVERALAVVDALEDGGEHGTNEIARRTGINASTVSRLLATLAGAGMVEHVSSNGRYRLGVRLVQLGNAVLQRIDLRSVARLHLQALASSTGETATLSAPGERDAITVDFVLSRASVQSVARVDRPSIAHATATGKVLLAFGTAKLQPGALKAYTPKTITDRRKLTAALERVRRDGWAEAVGEREPHLNAVAAPVRDARGELAAIMSVQGPSSRFDRDAMRSALAELLEHAGAVCRSSAGQERARRRRGSTGVRHPFDGSG